jgi:hypothetical protein
MDAVRLVKRPVDFDLDKEKKARRREKWHIVG